MRRRTRAYLGGHVCGYAHRQDGSWACVADYRQWPSLGCGATAEILPTNHQPDASRTPEQDKGVYRPPLVRPVQAMVVNRTRTGHEQDNSEREQDSEQDTNRTTALSRWDRLEAANRTANRTTTPRLRVLDGGRR